MNSEVFTSSVIFNVAIFAPGAGDSGVVDHAAEADVEGGTGHPAQLAGGEGREVVLRERAEQQVLRVPGLDPHLAGGGLRGVAPGAAGGLHQQGEQALGQRGAGGAACQQRRGRAFDYAILGTDISGRMIEKASDAVYTREQLAAVPVEMKRRYFMASSDPAYAGQMRVAPELRARVRFRHLNLMDQVYRVDKDVNVIFLRNILIYFGAEDQAAVVARLTDHLVPGGYLIVGHSESMVVKHPQLEHVKPTIFRKV